MEKIYDEYRKGKDALEIAEIIGCSPATVANKLLMIGVTDSYSVTQRIKRKKK